MTTTASPSVATSRMRSCARARLASSATPGAACSSRITVRVRPRPGRRGTGGSTAVGRGCVSGPVQGCYPGAYRVGSADLLRLVRRTAAGAAGRRPSARGAVRAVDAGGPPIQTLHRLPADVGGGRFYRICVIDGVLDHSPAEYVRRPTVPAESPTLGLTQPQRLRVGVPARTQTS